ncbi:MAG: hypothetical protein R6X02_20750 [Enhygromyxa sp.]
MQVSSRTRRKAAFVPWLAALVIGATAHAGWLLHELREPARPPSPVAIHVSVDGRIDGPGSKREVEPRARQQLAREPRTHARRTPAVQRSRSLHCRHAGAWAGEDELELELDMWIQRTDRYTYTIDRRVLDRVALADDDGELLDRLGVVARSLGLAEPLELRNIRAGTPLFVLGLRTGDRLHAISTRRDGAMQRVEVAIERRGRPIELVYELI